MSQFSSTTGEPCACCGGPCTCDVANQLPEPAGCENQFVKQPVNPDPPQYNRCGCGDSPETIDQHVSQWDYKWCQYTTAERENHAQCPTTGPSDVECVACGDCSKEYGITYIPVELLPNDPIIRNGSRLIPWYDKPDGWVMTPCEFFKEPQSHQVVKRGGYLAGAFWPTQDQWAPYCDYLEDTYCSGYGKCLIPCYDYMECAVTPESSYCENPPCPTQGDWGTEPNFFNGGPLRPNRVSLHKRICGNQQGTCVSTGEVAPSNLPELPTNYEECNAFFFSLPGCDYRGQFDSPSINQGDGNLCPGFPDIPEFCKKNEPFEECRYVEFTVVDSCEYFVPLNSSEYVADGIKSHAYNYCAIQCATPCNLEGCGNINQSCCPDIDGQTYKYDPETGTCLPCEA
jgi:hypothetical protein